MQTLLRRLRYPALLFAALLIAGGLANCVPKLPVPPGVTKRTEKLLLRGREKPADIYLPQNVAKAPVVIVSHGSSPVIAASWPVGAFFSRSTA